MINSKHNFKVACFSPFDGVSRNFDRRDRKEGEKIGRRKIEEEWGGKIASPLFRLVFFNVSQRCCKHSRIKRETESRFNAINRRVETTKICASPRFVTISSQRTANLGNSNRTRNFRGAHVSRILRLIKRIFCGIS